MEEIKKTEEKDIQPDDVLPEISIEELTLEMRDACDRAGWKSLTPVQAKSIPYFLADRDMMVQSRTGSGKTGAYILPIIQKINEQQIGRAHV
jgi:ATP-dependent RNA helicase DeaD